MEFMKIGVNKIKITPELGTGLAGYGMLNRKAVGVYDDLYLTSIVLEQDSKKAVIICADIIGFGCRLTTSLKQEIYKRYGFNEDEILLNASHTHSGPQTIENMNPYAGEIEENYISFLTNSIMTSIETSVNSMEEVDVYIGKAQCNIGINRRRIVEGKAVFAPNEDGIVDKDVTVVKFMKGEIVKAVLFNYTCHPTTIGEYHISADYPGSACRTIENAYQNNMVAVFMQGCCGDIRVRTIENGEFFGGDIQTVKIFGEKLGNSVLELSRGNMRKIKVNLSTKLLHFDLFLREIPDRKEIEDAFKNGLEFEKVWAKNIMLNYNSLTLNVPYTIHKISMGNDLDIIGMDGEVCVEYGLTIKEMYKNKTVITAGYCNGAAGYIPTGIMFEQGGYEPVGSKISYQLPSQFREDIEKIMMEQLIKLCKS